MDLKSTVFGSELYGAAMWRGLDRSGASMQHNLPVPSGQKVLVGSLNRGGCWIRGGGAMFGGFVRPSNIADPALKSI